MYVVSLNLHPPPALASKIAEVVRERQTPPPPDRDDGKVKVDESVLLMGTNDDGSGMMVEVGLLDGRLLPETHGEPEITEYG